MAIPRNHLWAAIPTAIAALFLICGYEFIRSPSESLFRAAYGVQNLPLIMGVMPLGVLLALYFYGKILTRLGPRRTLFWTTLGSAVIIALCYLSIRAGFRPANALLFIVKEVYVMVLVEQYWSFINSSVSVESEKKLNGPIIGISSLGAICGAVLVSKLAVPLGTLQLLLFTAALLIPAAFCSDFAYRKTGEPKPTETEKREHAVLALKHFKTEPILLILFLVVITTQIISAVLYFSFQGNLQSAIPDMDQQTAFSGRMFAMINTSSAFLQFIGAPLLFRFLSLRKMHLMMPLIHVTACVILTVHPSLATASVAFLLFKCFDYSIFRAAKEMLYVPLSYDVRYRAKEVIDVFGYRTGKGGMSLLLAAMQKAGVVLSGLYSIIALAGAGVWLALVFPMTKKRTTS